MKVAKKACVKCGSRSLRDEDGDLRCVQCGQFQQEGRPAPVRGPAQFDRQSKWDMPRR